MQNRRAFHRSRSYIQFNQPQTQEYRVEMYPGVICSAVHAATRCAFAITTLHPGSNLKNLAYEEGKKRGSLHGSPAARSWKDHSTNQTIRSRRFIVEARSWGHGATDTLPFF